MIHTEGTVTISFRPEKLTQVHEVGNISKMFTFKENSTYGIEFTTITKRDS